MLLEAEVEAPAETETQDSHIHFVCPVCFPEGTGGVTFCGVSLGPDAEDLPQDAADCVVCVDLYECPIHPIVYGWMDETHNFQIDEAR